MSDNKVDKTHNNSVDKLQSCYLWINHIQKITYFIVLQQICHLWYCDVKLLNCTGYLKQFQYLFVGFFDLHFENYNYFSRLIIKNLRLLLNWHLLV